jgi:hypothetical protein
MQLLIQYQQNQEGLFESFVNISSRVSFFLCTCFGAPFSFIDELSRLEALVFWAGPAYL